jgi:23S rRNA (pseudouridine1915-N3)-methyltransferase
MDWEVTLREVEARGKSAKGDLIRREGALLDAACPDGSRRVALDRAGRALSSEAFAERLGVWRDEGARDVAFLIGGAEGLERGLVDGADIALSFGAATWPHLLVRGMLMEQIYRAQQILAGHPYHRG